MHNYLCALYIRSANEEEEFNEPRSSTVMDEQRQVQMEALDHEIEYNELLISEREGEIQNIEQGITELNEIFRDMGMLVNEQESGIRKLNIIYIIRAYCLITHIKTHN